MTRPDYTALTFPDAPADRPYVILNMVMSADGKSVVEGTEAGIGSKDDQRLMRELRVHADMVLDGASTLRLSGASARLGDEALEDLRVERGKPRLGIAATLSRSGDLPLDRIFFTARDFEAVVYLAASATAERRAAIEATGRPVVTVPDDDEIPSLLQHARARLGVRLLLLEGGPGLNAQFFALGLIDEFFLTLGPVIVAGKDSLTAVEGAHGFTRATLPRLTLLHALPNTETDEVYLRYRVQH